jgi:NAD(P)-dependent dehydrogenase (short-subunit alcohol dehydrogenase family)
MKKLENKVAVITGGSSGIGFATAKRFIEEGARVVITGRDQGALDRAVEDLGGQVVGVQGDVAKVEDLDTLYRTVSSQVGKIDVLFVNAGIAPFVPVTDVTEEHFDQLFDINVKGAYFSVQKSLPHLADGASIILNSSVANRLGLEGTSVYSATKAAVRSLARTLSAELAPRGIRVNTLSPGFIETPLIGKLGLPQEVVEEFASNVMGQVPLGRPGRADEMASAVTFLASQESSYVVGAELIADGGLTQV